MFLLISTVSASFPSKFCSYDGTFEPMEDFYGNHETLISGAVGCKVHLPKTATSKCFLAQWQDSYWKKLNLRMQCTAPVADVYHCGMIVFGEKSTQPIQKVFFGREYGKILGGAQISDTQMPSFWDKGDDMYCAIDVLLEEDSGVFVRAQVKDGDKGRVSSALQYMPSPTEHLVEEEVYFLPFAEKDGKEEEVLFVPTDTAESDGATKEEDLHSHAIVSAEEKDGVKTEEEMHFVPLVPAESDGATKDEDLHSHAIISEGKDGVKKEEAEMHFAPLDSARKDEEGLHVHALVSAEGKEEGPVEKELHFTPYSPKEKSSFQSASLEDVDWHLPPNVWERYWSRVYGLASTENEQARSNAPKENGKDHANASKENEKDRSNASKENQKDRPNAPNWYEKYLPNAPNSYEKKLSNAPKLHEEELSTTPKLYEKELANAPKLYGEELSNAPDSRGRLDFQNGDGEDLANAQKGYRKGRPEAQNAYGKDAHKVEKVYGKDGHDAQRQYGKGRPKLQSGYGNDVHADWLKKDRDLMPRKGYKTIPHGPARPYDFRKRLFGKERRDYLRRREKERYSLFEAKMKYDIALEYKQRLYEDMLRKKIRKKHRKDR